MRLGCVAMGLLVTTLGCATQKHMRREEKEGRELRVELAQTYLEKGAYDAAVPLLQRAAAEDPKNPAVHAMYGTVLREKRLYPQAEREYKKALELKPDYAAAWNGLGITYDSWGRPKDAQQAHLRAVKLAPDNASYWNNLGFSLFVAGDHVEAIRALEQALSLDPTLTIAHNNLGFAYGRRKDYANAERCFQNGGNAAEAKMNLALVYEQNGELETAERLRAEARATQDRLETP